MGREGSSRQGHLTRMAGFRGERTMSIWGWARLSEPEHPPTWHKVREIHNLELDRRVRFDLACSTGSIVDDAAPAQAEPPATGESICHKCAATKPW
jgi:hypothetical protein